MRLLVVLLPFAFTIVALLIGCLIAYFLIRAAVRDGVTRALTSYGVPRGGEMRPGGPGQQLGTAEQSRAVQPNEPRGHGSPLRPGPQRPSAPPSPAQ